MATTAAQQVDRIHSYHGDVERRVANAKANVPRRIEFTGNPAAQAAALEEIKRQLAREAEAEGRRAWQSALQARERDVAAVARAQPKPASLDRDVVREERVRYSTWIKATDISPGINGNGRASQAQEAYRAAKRKGAEYQRAAEEAFEAPLREVLRRHPTGTEAGIARSLLVEIKASLDDDVLGVPEDPEAIVERDLERLREAIFNLMGSISTPVAVFNPLPPWRTYIFEDTPESIGAVLVRDPSALAAFERVGRQ